MTKWMYRSGYILTAISLMYLVALFIFVEIDISEETHRIENIKNQCEELFLPSHNITSYSAYEHCKLYPETYGVKP